MAASSTVAHDSQRLSPARAGTAPGPTGAQDRGRILISVSFASQGHLSRRPAQLHRPHRLHQLLRALPGTKQHWQHNCCGSLDDVVNDCSPRFRSQLLLCLGRRQPKLQRPSRWLGCERDQRSVGRGPPVPPGGAFAARSWDPLASLPGPTTPPAPPGVPLTQLALSHENAIKQAQVGPPPPSPSTRTDGASLLIWLFMETCVAEDQRLCWYRRASGTASRPAPGMCLTRNTA